MDKRRMRTGLFAHNGSAPGAYENKEGKASRVITKQCHLASKMILFADEMPQDVLMQEICVTPTRQDY